MRILVNVPQKEIRDAMTSLDRYLSNCGFRAINNIKWKYTFEEYDYAIETIVGPVRSDDGHLELEVSRLLRTGRGSAVSFQTNPNADLFLFGIPLAIGYSCEINLA